MKTILVLAILGLALLAPVGPVGTAQAVVCEPTDLQCQENQLRCYARTVTELRPVACPR